MNLNHEWTRIYTNGSKAGLTHQKSEVILRRSDVRRAKVAGIAQPKNPVSSGQTFRRFFFVHRPAVTGSFTARRPTAFTHADAPFKMTSFFLKRQPCERRLGRFASLGFVESHSCAFVSIRGLSQFESPLTSAPPATGESACLP